MSVRSMLFVCLFACQKKWNGCREKTHYDGIWRNDNKLHWIDWFKCFFSHFDLKTILLCLYVLAWWKKKVRGRNVRNTIQIVSSSLRHWNENNQTKPKPTSIITTINTAQGMHATPQHHEHWRCSETTATGCHRVCLPRLGFGGGWW